jgi:hypothetical protein
MRKAKHSAFEFTTDGVTVYRSSHNELLLDEQIPIKKVVRKFLRAFESIEVNNEGCILGWRFRIPKLKPLRDLIRQ